jgi:hypothetical protein
VIHRAGKVQKGDRQEDKRRHRLVKREQRVKEQRRKTDWEQRID